MSENKKTESIADKKVSRRSMLKWAGALAGAAIVGAVAEYGASELMKPVPPPPTPPPSFKPPLSADVKARVDAITQQLIAMHQGDTTVMTSCISNGCKGGPCAVLVHVKNGVMTTSENGDPLYRGTTIEDAYLNVEDTLKKNMVQIRPCTRGYLYPRTANQPNRLLHPMKRVGARGERKYVRISWEEALDTAANKIKELKDKYGPYIAGGSPGFAGGGTGGPASPYYGYGFVSWGVSSRAGHVLSSQEMFGWSVFGKGNIGSGTTAITSIFSSKAVVFLGTNPMMSYQANGVNVDKTYFLVWLHEQGIPVIVIDPIYNFTAEVMADQFIPIKAGTDMALMLALANVLYKEGIYQKDYVAKYVYGFDKWMDYVTGKTAGSDGAIDRTPEWAEPITGIPADTIRELARFMAKNAPQLWFSMYFSAAKHMYGETCGWASDALKAMLGTIGTIGGKGPEAPFGSVTYLTSPVVNTGAARATWTTPQLVASDCGSGIMYRLYQDLQAGKVTEDLYRRMIGCAKDWPLPRPVMRWGKSIGIGTFDTNNLIRGLKGLELVVSSGYHLDNPSTFYADILLPQADDFYEAHQGFKSGVSTINLNLKVAEPQGEARSSQWIELQIGKRLGLLDKMGGKLTPYVDDYKAMDDQLLALYKQAWETYIARDDIKPYNPPSWEDYLKAPIFRVPHVGRVYNKPTGTNPFDWFRDGPRGDFMGDPEKNPIDTPSGKMQVYSDWLANPDMPTTGIVTKMGFVMEMCYGGASPTLMPPMPEFTGHIQPDGPSTKFADQYPLCVMSLHSNYRAHHSNDSNPDFRIEARHACWLSIADAKARGVKDGDLVRVYSPRGEMILPAYVTARVAPGTANVGYGAWAELSSVRTALMPDGIDMRGMHNYLTPAAQYPWICGDNAVETNCQVEKVESGVVST
jgi:anaerobic dimethyl sulfoxide reductase subunit A